MKWLNNARAQIEREGMRVGNRSRQMYTQSKQLSISTIVTDPTEGQAS